MQPRWPPQCQEHTGCAPPGPWLGLGPLPEHAPRLRGRLLSFLNSLLGPHLSREIGRAGRLSVPPPSAGVQSPCSVLPLCSMTSLQRNRIIYRLITFFLSPHEMNVGFSQSSPYPLRGSGYLQHRAWHVIGSQ